jgi:CRISPR system Cascade subunit CasC
MSQFVQLHILTSYPPANLNRDDLGRPKTAVMGGETRLRISSQSLKRAWRTSEVFESALGPHLGKRTKEKGTRVYRSLIAGGVPEKIGLEAAQAVAGSFAKLESKQPKEGAQPEVETGQLVHYSPEELAAIDALVETLAAEKRLPTADELALLRDDHRAVDIALFGRMMADHPGYSMEAAAQVAHAITVHRTQVEDDFFSAVDDLNEGREDAGAGHLGETEFGAGLFYLYLCIDRDLLVSNLQGDEALAAQTLRALAEAALTVAPTGKQATFASRAYASYCHAETGRRQPRSLAVAFLDSVRGGDFLATAIERIEETAAAMDRAYGPVAEHRYTLNVPKGEGALPELLDFVAAPLAVDPAGG